MPYNPTEPPHHHQNNCKIVEFPYTGEGSVSYIRISTCFLLFWIEAKIKTENEICFGFEEY